MTAASVATPPHAARISCACALGDSRTDIIDPAASANVTLATSADTPIGPAPLDVCATNNAAEAELTRSAAGTIRRANVIAVCAREASGVRSGNTGSHSGHEDSPEAGGSI